MHAVAVEVEEARRLKLPVIALVDTNCDPDEADYVIPGNDDAIRSCSLIIKAVADGIEAGRAKVTAAELAKKKAKDEASAAAAAKEAKELAAAKAAAPAPEAAAEPAAEAEVVPEPAVEAIVEAAEAGEEQA